MSANFDDIQRAADLLRRGRVVAFPTETVYGLGADAFNPRAIDKVYELKGRPRHNPLIVHVSGPEMAKRVGREWPDRAAALARRFWPGPLSIIVPRLPTLPEIVTAGSDRVAVRCPNHPITLALLFELGMPLVGPSANLSGHVSPTSAEHVRESFAESGVFVLDGGVCEAGIESTVVDVTGPRPRVLRPGVISAEQIAEMLGCEVESVTRSVAAAEGSAAAIESPGQLDRHYSPRAPAHVFDEHEWPEALALAKFQSPAVVLTHRLAHVSLPIPLIEMPPDAAGYAAALYAALREADRQHASVILIERPPTGLSEGDDPLWLAITDRLARASTPLPEDLNDRREPK